jgi:hypothetical protein
MVTHTMTAHTAFFGYGGTTKTIPELTLEAAEASKMVDMSLVTFFQLRDNATLDKAYFYEGAQILSHLKKHLKRMNNRLDKLTIAYNIEAKEHRDGVKEKHKKEYPKASDVEAQKINNVLEQAIKETDAMLDLQGVDALDALDDDDEIEL